jgi:hypothetical protein
MNPIKQTKTDSSIEWEPNTPFVLKWKNDSEYDLIYKSKFIGEGMAPKDLVIEYVRLMNWAYNEGKREIK